MRSRPKPILHMKKTKNLKSCGRQLQATHTTSIANTETGAGTAEFDRPPIPKSEVPLSVPRIATWDCPKAVPLVCWNPERKLIRPFDLRELGYNLHPARIGETGLTLVIVEDPDTLEMAQFTFLYCEALGLGQIQPRSLRSLFGFE